MSEARNCVTRQDYNRETLDLWLGAFAGGYIELPDDIQPGKMTRRGKSRIPFNMTWMRAQQDPAVRETHDLLSRLFFVEMQNRRPLTFDLFHYLYFRDEANPAEAEMWRQKGKREGTLAERKMYLKDQMLRRGKIWVLKQVEKSHVKSIVVPDPINPKGFVEQSKKSQRTARRVYWQNVDKVGDKQARDRASRASGYTARHIRRIIPPKAHELGGYED